MTATVYVVADKLAGRNDWDEGPTLPLMTAEEVRTAAAEGFEVGSHSLNHVRLAGLPAADLRREIADSRAALEDLLGQHVTSFCYPYGNWDAAAASSVADAGYDNACEVDDYTRPARFSIPRFYVGQADLGLRLWAKHLRHRLRLLSRARRS
jgi:peptidoglycan/xylan/chitin deacetylase (PgdA/CDA1 family)